MIKLDANGLPVDGTGDGGDSAVRAGILKFTGFMPNLITERYHKGEGLLVRHPTQRPWNNPGNFSRDQLMCLIPALSPDTVKKVLWSRIKAFCFAQNFERDAVGTTKYPYPHVVDGEKRWFDYADPLLPNHIGAMVLRAKEWRLYWMLPVAYLLHVLFLVLHAKGKHYEENQTIAECTVYGTLGLYKKLKPHWKDVSAEYWGKRGEKEYHDMLVKWVEK